MTISNEQAMMLAINHSARKIVNMKRKDMELLCIHLSVDSYKDPVTCVFNVNSIIEELFNYYNQDISKVVDFLKENNIDVPDIKDFILSNFSK